MGMKKWLLLLPNAALLLGAQAAVFDFGEVRQQAAALAAAPFRPSTNELPAVLAQLSYEQYQAIHFDASKALWREEGLPFWIEFFQISFLQIFSQRGSRFFILRFGLLGYLLRCCQQVSFD